MAKPTKVSRTVTSLARMGFRIVGMRFEPEKRAITMATKNKPDAIMSAAGWATTFLSQVITTLRESGMTDGEIHHLGTIEGVGIMKLGVEAYCEVVVGSRINLDEFFKTQPGRRVSPEFRDRILAPALMAKSHKRVLFGSSSVLPSHMTGQEIREYCGEKYIFTDVYGFCRALAREVNRQLDGERGVLHLNRANFFLVIGESGEIHIVVAEWHLHDWKFYTRPLSDDLWSAGAFLFRPSWRNRV